MAQGVPPLAEPGRPASPPRADLCNAISLDRPDPRPRLSSTQVRLLHPRPRPLQEIWPLLLRLLVPGGAGEDRGGVQPGGRPLEVNTGGTAREAMTHHGP